jgi:DNA-binding MarR family transcriptional regulator
VRHHSDQTRRLLEHLSSGTAISQRALSQRLGIALGLTNQLLRGLSGEGLITSVRMPGNRVSYALTDAGRQAQERLSREHLTRALESYSAARDRIRRSLSRFAERRANGSRPHVVFYGLGEAAEIGAVCAPDAGVIPVGVVNDTSDDVQVLSGLPVWPPARLTADSLAGQPFDWILVTALSRTEEIRDRLDALGLTNDRVCWL